MPRLTNACARWGHANADDWRKQLAFNQTIIKILDSRDSLTSDEVTVLFEARANVKRIKSNVAAYK